MKTTGIKFTSLLVSINLLVFLSGFCLMLFSSSQASAAPSVVGQEEQSMENCGAMPVLLAENSVRIDPAPPEPPECCLAQNHAVASLITASETVRKAAYHGDIAAQEFFSARNHGSDSSALRRPFPPPKNYSLSNTILRI